MQIDEEHRHLIALGRIKGVGPIVARQLLAHVGSAVEVFSAGRSKLMRIYGIGLQTAEAIEEGRADAMRLVDKELAFADRYGIEILAYTDDNYPERLKQCDDSPIILYKKGKADLNVPTVLSVVGTRRPTEEGREICQKIVTDIIRRHPRTLIVSGLAYGIDVCAHRATLAEGGCTVGVLAHGLDMIYPAAHRDTAGRMLADGALLTEYMTGTQPDAPNFVSRNRIVAGMSDATLVVESGTKGGALITARLAQGYNRDVMAIPGFPGREASLGCNTLIKNNVAALVESAEDIENVLGWQASDNKKSQPAEPGNLFAAPEGDDQKAIYNALVAEGMLTASLLSVRCQIPVSKINAVLLEMEFSGIVKSMPGNSYKLTK